MSTLVAFAQIAGIICSIIALRYGHQKIKNALHRHDQTLVLQSHGYAGHRLDTYQDLPDIPPDAQVNLLDALVYHFSDEHFSNRLADFVASALRIAGWIARGILIALLLFTLLRLDIGQPALILSTLWWIPVIQIVCSSIYIALHFLCRMLSGRGIGEPSRANARYQEIYRQLREHRKGSAWQRL